MENDKMLNFKLQKSKILLTGLLNIHSECTFHFCAEFVFQAHFTYVPLQLKHIELCLR